MCHMCHTQSLGLSNNQIGNAGVTALANACAGGAMASLKELVVDNPQHPALKAACKTRGIDLY